MNDLILTFDAIRKGDIEVAGGKGANLGEMTAAGIVVPQGFVVMTESYRLFLKENGLTETIRQALDAAGDDETRLLAAAAQFRSLIRAGCIPATVENAIRRAYTERCLLRVAVRSSATAEDLEDASYAGQQETYLNVRGIDAVLARSIFCRRVPSRHSRRMRMTRPMRPAYRSTLRGLSSRVRRAQISPSSLRKCPMPTTRSITIT